MYVCICKGVTLGTVREVIGDGAATVDEVERRCRAGGDCGACRETIAELIADERCRGCPVAALMSPPVAHAEPPSATWSPAPDHHHSSITT